MIGDKIKKIRLYHNLTQKEVALHTGVCQGDMSNYERNFIKPRMEFLLNLLNYYGISLEDFLHQKYKNVSFDKNRLVIKDDFIRKLKFGACLQKCRLNNNYSKQYICKILDISIKSLQDIEKGIYFPDLKHLKILCDMYYITPDIPINCYINNKVFLNLSIEEIYKKAFLSIETNPTNKKIKQIMNQIIIEELDEIYLQFLLVETLQEEVNKEITKHFI